MRTFHQTPRKSTVIGSNNGNNSGNGNGGCDDEEDEIGEWEEN